MESDRRTETIEAGGRARWLCYTKRERELLEREFLGDWENLDFLGRFWNPIFDDRDLFQYRRTAQVWRKRLKGKSFKYISKELGIDQRKAFALTSGKNLHPYLVQMYLNHEMLPRPRNGWKWVLQCAPKPTNAFPKAVAVPEKVQTYQDILDFLKQFPPVPSDHPSIHFFGLTSEWVEQHKPQLFGFLLGFLVGDAGKQYPEYETRARHYAKTAMQTNMANTESNHRVLTYVQLALRVIGIESRRYPSKVAIRWNSESSSLLTWIIRVCLGLRISERTSRDPLRMDWLLECPREFLIAFIQGLAESDGSMSMYGYYAAIASVPNSKFYLSVLARARAPSRVHPKLRPTQLRINLETALALPLFNPTIKSYRFVAMMSHAKHRRIQPPSPSFFHLGAYRTLRHHDSVLPMAVQEPTDGVWTAYFWAWSKKTVYSHNKVMVRRLLLLSPDGEIKIDEEDGKTIVIFPGRMSDKKMRVAAKSYVELNHRERGLAIDLPLKNVLMRKPEEIDRILANARSDLKGMT